MNIARQSVSFALVGGLLVVVDWAVFVGLTAISVQAVPANILGRVAGAMLGFWLNGRLTFGRPGAPRHGIRRFARFAISWVLVTLVSTVLIGYLTSRLSLHAAWIAKPLVEGALAIVSFFVSRHWVYR